MKKENKMIARKKKNREVKKERAKETFKLVMLIGIPVIAVLLLILSTIIDFKAVFNGTYNTPKFFSKYLNEDGFIKDYDISDYVDVKDYKAYVIDKATVEPTEDDIDSKISNNLKEYGYQSTDTSIAIENGMSVNIDYVGTLNGVEFDGGSTQGNGTDLVIGSGSYVGDFEEQLIGHKVGDRFTITVQFPDYYPNNTDLENQFVDFDVTINSILEIPVLTDELVVRYFGDTASTVEEYREKIKAELSATAKKNIITSDIDSNKVTSYPDGYLEHIVKITDFVMESQYEYIKSMNISLGNLKNKYDYYGMTKDEYNKFIKEKATLDADHYMIVEAIWKQFDDIKITEDDIVSFWKDQGAAEDYDELLKTYGKGYATRMALSDVLIEYLAEHVQVQ